MAILPGIFGQGSFQNTANMTPDQIERKRAYIAAMMPKFGNARYVGEGLGQLATGVAIGRQNKKLDASEGAGRESADKMFERIFGTANSATSPDMGPLSVLGMQPSEPAPPRDPNSPGAIAGDAMAALGKTVYTPGDKESFVAAMMPHAIKVSQETGLDPRLVIAQAAQETGWGKSAPGNNFFGIKSHGKGGGNTFATNEVIDGKTVRINDSFRGYDSMGDSAMGYAEFLKENPRYGEMLAAGDLDGQLAALGASGYATDPNYAASVGAIAKGIGLPEGFTPGQGAAPAPTSAPQIPINELYMALQNPWLSADQKALVTSMIQEQQAASDPMKQIELEKAQIELAQLQNPTDAPPEDFTARMFTLNALGIDPQTEEGKVYLMTGKAPEAPGTNTPAGFATLDMQAQAAGFAPGTPEYQEFMRNGGGSGAPAAFIALDLQAKAAGFEPGTPEYKEFMGTRGAGAIAEAKTKGEAAGTAASALPGASSMAALVDQQIQDLKNDPYLPNMLGPVDSWLPNVSEDAARVQGRIDQLQGGAFLQARQMLKGGGAITDFEGQKAEAAFVRMNAAQSMEDFTAALDEFNAAVKEGVRKLEGQAGGGAAAPSAQPAAGGPATISTDAEYDALPSGATFVGPDGKTRRKP